MPLRDVSTLGSRQPAVASVARTLPLAAGREPAGDWVEHRTAYPMPLKSNEECYTGVSGEKLACSGLQVAFMTVNRDSGFGL